MDKPVKIGIVAGEVSGDILGAALMRSLQSIYPNISFEGIGGDRMIAVGFDSLVPMDRLSVMGFVEPLKRLPELLRIRRTLYRHFLHNNFDLVLGIDSPDFNLGLELKLRRKGVLTAHYVSPSVWAWREGRIKKIARAVDHMLTLFPFESDFYHRHQVPVTFVGHPLADEIPLQCDQQGARSELGLPPGLLLAIMPGSRASEVSRMCRLFLDVATQLHRQTPDLHFIIPAANASRYGEISQCLTEYPDLPVTLVNGNSHQVMAASDAVLLTSGTTALEAMLLKKPMVVAYRMGSLSHWLISQLLKTPYISLPNLIANKSLVPELIQSRASVENLVTETQKILFDSQTRNRLQAEFLSLHQSLLLGASDTAAKVLAGLIAQRSLNIC